jgi:hypothetical protein
MASADKHDITVDYWDAGDPRKLATARPNTELVNIKQPLPPVTVLRAEGATGSVAVNDNALRQFADIIRGLQPHIDNARDRLSNVDIRAGNFKDADEIVNKVGTRNTDGGLTKVYLDHLKDLGSALTLMAKRMTQLADRYGKTESTNAITSQELSGLVEDIQSYFKIPGVTPTGQAPTPPPTSPGGAPTAPGAAPTAPPTPPPTPSPAVPTGGSG